ncbi:5-formyltetrahydrofolate cyclo-ligase [Aestuariivivens sediminicola]|uniref:5-formyltetrahydrofolate cyclo-ligase n=1 Tax=Aestuariivivens sediminicola TaxID=2913560 RepID=UPI001F574F54|nr:5-formyltetrahydrofolate cyclo-ligase [Aestuariivivens sediminicola]
MTKAELRRKYKSLRHHLTQNDIDDLSLAIANQLLKLPVWEHSFYHVFLTIVKQKEINTDYILNILSGKDKNIVISKSDFNTGLMTNYLLTDNTVLKNNAWGIPEPAGGIEIENQAIDVVFVPLLAFDKQGHRVGYGKGFYDTFLSECNSDTVKIGLSFFEAEDRIDGLYDTDITLNYCVTPKQIFQF